MAGKSAPIRTSKPAAAGPVGTTATGVALDQLFDRWLSATFVDIRRNRLVLLQEADGNRVAVLDRILAVLRDHCVDPNVTAKRLTELGAPATAKLVREHLPSSKRARSGDVG